MPFCAVVITSNVSPVFFFTSKKKKNDDGFFYLLKPVLLQTDDVQVKVRTQAGGLVERQSARQSIPVGLKDRTDQQLLTQSHAFISSLALLTLITEY